MVLSCFPAQITQGFLHFPLKWRNWTDPAEAVSSCPSCLSQRCWKESESLKGAKKAPKLLVSPGLSPGRMWWHFLLLFLPWFIPFPLLCLPLAWGMMLLQQLLSPGEKEFLNCSFPTLILLLKGKIAEEFCAIPHLPCSAGVLPELLLGKGMELSNQSWATTFSPKISFKISIFKRIKNKIFKIFRGQGFLFLPWDYFFFSLKLWVLVQIKSSSAVLCAWM